MGMPRQRIVVAGGGAFGGWTALWLQRAGAQVTLIDRHGPGNALSSSGGASRVIRHVYARRHHVEMASRALSLWQEADQDWGEGLFHRKGVLFMASDEGMLPAAAAHMQSVGVAFERLDGAALATRFPQMVCDGFDDAIFEPGAGYLDANRACEVVRDALLKEGGEYRQGRVIPGKVSGGEMHAVALENGSALEADRFVFACGPWLRDLFPSLLAPMLSVTRQEVYFFRTPARHLATLNHDLPVWAVLGHEFWYGIPGDDGLFKLANDRHGPVVDPESQSREPSPHGVAAARVYMESRFPGMRGAPYASGKVCQYTVSGDDDFILDLLPGANNAWLLGAGSGHGFKHGPALGELAAGCVLGHLDAPQPFLLKRFQGSLPGE
jgi:sarcosine oxidase